MNSVNPDKILVLGIDTSSSHGTVGLMLGDKSLGDISMPQDRTFSEKLLPAIDCLFRSAGVTTDDLGLVAVVRGPGSFTGLRIGLATTKGLVYTKGVQAVGVVSLEALAWEAASSGEPVTAVLPARPGWVYTATYRRCDQRLECLRPPELTNLDEWIGALGSADLLVGEGALRYRAMLKEVVPQLRIAPDPERHSSKGTTVARLGRLQFLQKGGQKAESLVPLYLQPSLAELRWKQRQSSRDASGNPAGNP